MAAKRKPATKKKIGRPTKRDDRAERAIMASLRAGSSLITAAQCAGIDRETLRRWSKEDPAFAAACDKASSEAKERMSAAIYRKAIEKGDMTAAIWWQKTRDPESREPKDQPTFLGVDLGIEKVETAEDVAQFAARVLQAVANGEIDIETAGKLNALVQIAVAREFELMQPAKA